MSKADELFKNLRYTKSESEEYIAYSGNETLIQFNLITKTIEISCIINIQELQAINEKVKELRWLDE